jgi:hypothetical protein
VTDAAGAQRELVKDALGRLTDVYEDPAGSNFHTQYVADALNNVRQVMQGGSRSSRSGASTAWITSASLASGQLCSLLRTLGVRYCSNWSGVVSRSLTAAAIHSPREDADVFTPLGCRVNHEMNDSEKSVPDSALCSSASGPQDPSRM